MSGDGGGTVNTNLSESNQPWKPAQSPIKTALGDAESLYKAGIGFQPYTGSTVIPFANQTVAGMNDIMKNADTKGGDLTKAYDFYGSTVDEGGLTAEQQDILGQWMGITKADPSTTTPEFDRVLNRMERDAADQVNLTTSGMGRYGSGTHQGVLADTVGGIADEMLVGEYVRNQNRAADARVNAAGLGQQGTANAMAAAGAMPAAYTALSAPAKDKMTIGSMYEDLATRTKGDELRIFNEANQAPLKAVEWLNAIGSGAGALGGKTSQTASKPAPNPFLQALAAATGASNLLLA